MKAVGIVTKQTRQVQEIVRDREDMSGLPELWDNLEYAVLRGYTVPEVTRLCEKLGMKEVVFWKE